MAIDLDKMSEKELTDLRTQVDRALSSGRTRRRAEARRAAEDAASKHGFSLGELLGDGGGRAGKTKAPPKYRNPADASQTWSGRGRQPGWLKEGMAKGKSMSDFAI